MSFKKILFIVTIAALFAASITATVWAEDRPNLKDQVKTQLNTGAEESGLKIKGQEAPDVRIFGSTLINTLMGAYGIIFVILMVYSGHQLITAHGNEEKIERGYKVILGAIIGLILILTSYSIAYFVGKAAKRATRFGTESININYE